MAYGTAKRKKVVQEAQAPDTVVKPAGGGGICSTCNHAPDCAHVKRNPAAMVWECDEFYAYAEPARKKLRLSAAKGFDGVEHRGLCMNCDDRDSCTYPKPEAGIWHCEEYKS